MKLYEIPHNIEIAQEALVDPETGECLTEEQVKQLCDSLSANFYERVEYLSKVVLNQDAEIKALQEHEAKIKARIKARKNANESLKKYLAFCLNGEKFKSEDGLVSLSYRTTKDVVKIDEIALIPDEYFKTPHTESNLSKTAIKEALQAGEFVKGAHLEDSTSLVIRG